MKGKPKGRFRKGKYIQPKLSFHIKAKRAPKKPYLALTIRLAVDDVRNTLCPQINQFLAEIERQDHAKKKKKAKRGA
jgi:hypothetical protein